MKTARSGAKERDRRPTVLEFFLLGLIHFANVDTTYELRRRAGLTWGGIRPSLLRLERWRLLGRSPGGGRRKRAFRLTAEGRRLLQAFRRQPLDPYATFETVLRTVWLARQLDPSHALAIIDQAIGDHRFVLDAMRNVTADGPTLALRQFEEMRLFYERRRLECEVQILEDLLKQMEVSSSHTGSWRDSYGRQPSEDETSGA